MYVYIYTNVHLSTSLSQDSPQTHALQVLTIMEQCAAAENDDSGKPSHPVRIADCGVCGVYEPAPMAWVRHPE